MSERGVIAVDRGQKDDLLTEPRILIPIEEWDRFDDGRSPFTRREAYIWMDNWGPTPCAYRSLAREWRWGVSKTRRYIYSMVGSGLFKLDGLSIIAVDLHLAVPAPIEGKWYSLRAAVFARDNHRCTYCGSSEELQCDHIFPRAKGGMDVLENLTTACRSCNASKRDKLLSEWVR